MSYLITVLAVMAALAGGIMAFAVRRGRDAGTVKDTPAPHLTGTPPAPPPCGAGGGVEAGHGPGRKTAAPHVLPASTMSRFREDGVSGDTDAPDGAGDTGGTLGTALALPDWGGPFPHRTLHFEAAGRTNGGEDGENAAAFLVQDGLVAVADGTPSTGEGHRASALALGAVVFGRTWDPFDPVWSLEKSMEVAGDWLRNVSDAVPGSGTMSAHLGAAALSRSGEGWTLAFARAGDVTVYVFPGPDTGEMVTNARPAGRRVSRRGLDRRAAGAPDGLGGEVGTVSAAPGTLVVVGTGGFASALSFPDVQAVVRRNFGASPHTCAGALLDAAYRRRVSGDVTVAVARVTEVTGYGWEREGSGNHPTRV
ncbi:hypothetical protein GCM10017673_53090 [Streptosporangium violaceochromogenes]|nr:hypothetical protein GCM10017673_53090 [Streptosporangium violaceochromogenes]